MPDRHVLKFGTGQPIPEGAVYLSTIAQTHTDSGRARWVYTPDRTWEKHPTEKRFEDCWFVWHYFLVETPDA